MLEGGRDQAETSRESVRDVGQPMLLLRSWTMSQGVHLFTKNKQEVKSLQIGN